MTKRITFVFLSLLFVCVLCTCPSEKKNRPQDLLYFEFCNVDEENSPENWYYSAIENDSAHSGNYVVNKLQYKKAFNKELLDQNLLVVFEGMFRTSDIEEKGEIVFSITQQDSILFKQTNQHHRKIKKTGEWTKIIDTCIITKNFISTNNNINISFANSKIEGDDFSVKMYNIHQYSFLPEIPETLYQSEGEKNILFKNNFYHIAYSPNIGSIELLDKKKLTLSKQIIYCLQYKLNRDSINVHSNYFRNFKLEKQSKDSLLFTLENDSIKLQLILFTNELAELKWKVERSYKKNIFIEREALVFEMQDNVSEVYRTNRKNEQENLQREYWLDKEGVKFGQGERSIYWYHNTQISSLQVSIDKRLLFVNLDLNIDHPFIQFPLTKDGKELQKDLSNRATKTSSKVSNEFSFFIGIETHSLPRFMKNKNGFLATYIFTEHADFTDMKTQYAVNFGSEDIHTYQDATGGFAKYNIPVTKSIFYVNPTHQNNNVANKNFNTEICNLKGTPSYENFLKQLHQNDFEICLHSPEHQSSNRKTLEEALSYLQKNYNSKSWIDHGYSNGIENNREDFMCDGLNPSSPFYAADLWRKYNTQYFWNGYNEHHWLFTQYKHKNSLNDIYHGWGDQFPQPDYWLQEKGIYSWPSNQHFVFSNATKWQEIYCEENIRDLVYNQGTCINHCYPSSVDDESVFFERNEKGKYVAKKEFNKALELLDKYRTKKLLNVTTIREYLDYRIAVDQIEYRIISKHKIEIYSPQKIDGLSMTVQSNNVKINGKKINTKKIGNDLIFWFDVEAGDKVVIEY